MADAPKVSQPTPSNPANTAEKSVHGADFIPMNTPQQMLEVPPIPGYVLYWFADRPGRIARAQRGGYEFVSPEEVKVNNFGLAEDVSKSGNTDLGSRVSLHGGVAESGGSERLYLMKIKKDLWDRSQKLLEDRNESVAAAIRGGNIGQEKEVSGDGAQRYIDKKRTKVNMFTRKPARPAA